jgi:hypothetical protein
LNAALFFASPPLLLLMMVGQNNSHYGQRGRVNGFHYYYYCRHYLLLHSCWLYDDDDDDEKTLFACSLFIIVAVKHICYGRLKGLAESEVGIENEKIANSRQQRAGHSFVSAVNISQLPEIISHKSPRT